MRNGNTKNKILAMLVMIIMITGVVSTFGGNLFLPVKAGVSQVAAETKANMDNDTDTDTGKNTDNDSYNDTSNNADSDSYNDTSNNADSDSYNDTGNSADTDSYNDTSKNTNNDVNSNATNNTNTPPITSVNDLDGRTIGVQIGTTGDIYASDYEGDEAGTQIVRFNKGTDAVQALKQNKIDCIIIDEQPAKAFVQKNADLQILEEEFVQEEYAIAVAKENKTLCNQINEALTTLRENGTLDRIIQNYIGEEAVAGTMPYEPKDVKRTNGTLTMATNVAFPPYEYYENGAPTGIDVDMAQAIADELGMELKVEDMEFDSIITAVSSGKADVGIAGMTVTEDRLKNISFTQAYTTSKQVIVVKSEAEATGNGEVEDTDMTLLAKFHQNFIEDNRWQYLAKGFGNTIVITFFAALIGIVLGFLIALVRVTHDRTKGCILLNGLCQLYLTVIRGTPVLVQLMIIYYVIFASVNVNKVLVAIIAFGLNSAAYVAEVVRSGIMSIDNGQLEAGRSLGLNYAQTMFYVILPQAFKNVLPALCNEFIALLKETSVSGYIGLVDLTKGGDIIRSNTWEAFMPLIAVAIIYLVVVMLLSAGVGRLERRLKKDEQ